MRAADLAKDAGNIVCGDTGNALCRWVLARIGGVDAALADQDNTPRAQLGALDQAKQQLLGGDNRAALLLIEGHITIDHRHQAMGKRLSDGSRVPATQPTAATAECGRWLQRECRDSAIQ